MLITNFLKLFAIFIQRGSSISSTPCLSREGSRTSTGAQPATATAMQHSMLVQTSFDSTVGHLPHTPGSHAHGTITKDGNLFQFVNQIRY